MGNNISSGRSSRAASVSESRRRQSQTLLHCILARQSTDNKAPCLHGTQAN